MHEQRKLIGTMYEGTETGLQVWIEGDGLEQTGQYDLLFGFQMGVVSCYLTLPDERLLDRLAEIFKHPQEFLSVEEGAEWIEHFDEFGYEVALDEKGFLCVGIYDDRMFATLGVFEQDRLPLAEKLGEWAELWRLQLRRN